MNQATFTALSLTEKIAGLQDVSERIAQKYISSNSFRMEKSDLSQELMLVAYGILSNDENANLGYIIKSMYNKAVNIYHSYKNLRNSENLVNDELLEIVVDKTSDRLKSSNFQDSEGIYENNKSFNNKRDLTSSSKLGTEDDYEMLAMITDLLSMLENFPLERKYVLIKLKVDGILDRYGLEYEEINNVKVENIDGEYDAVMALEHYTSPKSGSWYGKKSELKLLIQQYLNDNI